MGVYVYVYLWSLYIIKETQSHLTWADFALSLGWLGDDLGLTWADLGLT
jgi:hypothetical protein